METPQRRLAIELRIAIDRAMRHESPRRVGAVRRLVRDNPHGTAASHVRHNLGERRLAWLARVARGDTTPERGSLAARKEQSSGQDGEVLHR